MVVTLILCVIVIALLYSVTFVTQPIKSMAPIDQAYTKMLNDIVLLIVGGIGGVMTKRAAGAASKMFNPQPPMQHGCPPMMGGMPSSPPVTMNVSVNASGTENIRDLLDLLKGGDMMGGDDAVSGPVGAVLSIDGEEEHGEEENPLDMLTRDEDDRGEEDGKMFGDEEEVEEEADGAGFDRASTTPDPQTAPLGAAFPKGNDMHSKAGNEVPKVNGGGNPFGVNEEELIARLGSLYETIKNR
jgi:hypothetical protein